MFLKIYIRYVFAFLNCFDNDNNLYPLAIWSLSTTTNHSTARTCWRSTLQFSGRTNSPSGKCYCNMSVANFTYQLSLATTSVRGWRFLRRTRKHEWTSAKLRWTDPTTKGKVKYIYQLNFSLLMTVVKMILVCRM